MDLKQIIENYKLWAFSEEDAEKALTGKQAKNVGDYFSTIITQLLEELKVNEEDFKETLYKNFRCSCDCDKGFFKSRSRKTIWECEQCKSVVEKIVKKQNDKINKILNK